MQRLSAKRKSIGSDALKEANMSERDWAAEARELVDAWVTTLDTQAGSWLTFDDLLRLRAATEASLRAAAAVPAGCVRDDNGVVRKVLGTLPVTADNMIAGSAASLWWLDHTTVVQHVSVLPIRVDDCYSTREAAQAALAAREGGR